MSGDGLTFHALVDGNDVDLSDQESITKDNTTNTAWK
jgi:hypothetical protein